MCDWMVNIKSTNNLYLDYNKVSSIIARISPFKCMYICMCISDWMMNV